MRFRYLLRVLLAMVAVLAGSSSATVALAHGISHAREAHQTADHEGQGSALHPSDSHGHTVLQIANAKRVDKDLIGPVAPAVVTASFIIETKHGYIPAGRTESAVDRATGPPPQTRAPPLL
jgi:hypothetical protein